MSRLRGNDSGSRFGSGMRDCSSREMGANIDMPCCGVEDPRESRTLHSRVIVIDSLLVEATRH